MLIAGTIGTGKSHVVQALGHCALRAGYDVLFITHNKLLAQLHAARATNTYEKKLMQLAKIDVMPSTTSAYVRCARHRTKTSMS